MRFPSNHEGTRMMKLSMLIVSLVVANPAAPPKSPVNHKAEKANTEPAIFSQIRELGNPKLTSLERTRRGLRLLQDEMEAPLPPPPPPYTDFRTHDYALTQIVLKL